jgi:hypothetical protein
MLFDTRRSTQGRIKNVKLKTADVGPSKERNLSERNQVFNWSEYPEDSPEATNQRITLPGGFEVRQQGLGR